MVKASYKKRNKKWYTNESFRESVCLKLTWQVGTKMNNQALIFFTLCFWFEILISGVSKFRNRQPRNARLENILRSKGLLARLIFKILRKFMFHDLVFFHPGFVIHRKAFNFIFIKLIKSLVLIHYFVLDFVKSFLSNIQLFI